MGNKAIKRRARFFVIIVVLIFLILSLRLAYLQIFQVEKFKTLAQQNHIRFVSIPAPRGEIFARDAKTKIVSNRPVYTVSLMSLSSERENMLNVIENLAKILEMDPEEIRKKLEEEFGIYHSVKIASDVSLDKILNIEQHSLELPGVVIDVEPVRDYPLGPIASHVVGYVREINAEQLEKFKDKGYRMGDDFGQTGLEYFYEEYLRGTPGIKQVEVDAMGRVVRELIISNPVPGNNLILTIDHNVQIAAEEALKTQLELLQKEYPDARAGSVVAIDVNTGGIIALANYPSYDPSIFTRTIKPSEFKELYDPKVMRFLNRALNPYPPGSTFKMVVAVAGLETGIIDPDYKLATKGYFFIEGTRINDWKPGGHGLTDLRKAIKESVNSYFCYFGSLIGNEVIADYAKQFGLGRVLGIDLPGEQMGILPTEEWKYKLYKQYLTEDRRKKLEELKEKYDKLIAAASSEAERKKLKNKFERERALLGQEEIMWELSWRAYDTPLISIGQGIVKYTPLQLACYTAAIANGGKLYKPHLVKKIVTHDGKLKKSFEPEVINRVNVSPLNLAIVRQGMEMATQPGGTAYGIFNDLPFTVAAKTGTAEIAGRDNHGLIVAYAPADNPQVAVAVVIEHAGSGARGAGPVARDVLAAYFQNN